MKKNQSVNFKKYNALVHPQRVRFMTSPGINFFMTHQSKMHLHAFLIVWTGLSIKMTEQVETWIKRAGESCESKNLTEVGSKLKYHASQEADHDLMLVDDLNVLIEKWNEIYNDILKSDDVFKLSSPTNTKAYIELHENAINGDHPYTQVAIEYEIERISVQYGPKMIENIIYTLGEDFNDGLSFLQDHVLLDQGHTKFNIDLLERCFLANGNLQALAETGTNALKIYSGFLNECVQLSSYISEREQCKSNLTI